MPASSFEIQQVVEQREQTIAALMDALEIVRQLLLLLCMRPFFSEPGKTQH